jgi:hypothetical protein
MDNPFNMFIKRSWVNGRLGLIPSISIVMAWASLYPITIGNFKFELSFDSSKSINELDPTLLGSKFAIIKCWIFFNC